MITESKLKKEKLLRTVNKVKHVGLPIRKNNCYSVKWLPLKEMTDKDYEIVQYYIDNKKNKKKK